jgi:glycosyltransferase involved in cell wall biosynthesis
MPVFAHAAFVAAAVSSLLAQDVTDWELVVVDDGSPDDVAAALPPDERIVLMRHERNRGLGAAMNTGLDRARAHAIAYLPADDVWLRGHLTALLGLLDDAGPWLIDGPRIEAALVEAAQWREPRELRR